MNKNFNIFLIVFIFFLIYFLVKNYYKYVCVCASNYIFEDYVKKVVINEDMNIIMLFKINDSVSDMKNYDNIYKSEKDEKDLKT